MRSASAPESRFPRLALLAGFLIAALILALLAWLLAHTLLRNVAPSPEAIDAVRRTLVPEIRQNLAPKPLERSLFILLTLSSPFCVLAGLLLAPLLLRAAPNRLAPPALALLAGGIGTYFLHGGDLFPYFVFPASPVLDTGIVFAAAALLYAACRIAPRILHPHRVRWLILPLAFAVALLPRGLSTRSILTTREISPFAWENHFQAVAYSQSQVFAGKPLLTAAPPLYGYYSEFLLPVFKIIGLSVFKFCFVMGLLQAIALTAVLMVASRYLRTIAARLLCCAALLYFTGSTCLVGKRPFDPLFQYYPIRFLFPALSVPLFLWAARRATPALWIGLGLFAGLGLMWNLDSGLAPAGAILFVLALEALAAIDSPRRKSAFAALALTTAAMLATAALFWLFLKSQSAWRPPFHYTADYQRLFYQSGLMMTPIPLEPHPWWMVVAAYLLGMGFGIQRILAGNRNAVTRLILFLSILGAGLFTYFEGRSLDFNLMNAAWPALLLAGLFADRLVRAIRARLLPRAMCWLALPAAYLGLMALAMLPAALANLWSFGSAQWRAALAATAPDPIARRVQFIRTHVGADPDCVILADYQAVYFIETGLRSTIDAPGLTEIFFLEDLAKIRSALLQSPPRHLFADPATLKNLQLTDAVAAHFQIRSTTPDGKLLYLEPR